MSPPRPGSAHANSTKPRSGQSDHLRRLALPVALVALVALSGCSPLVCPAIGYLNTVEIAVADSAVFELECVEGCAGGVGDLSQGGSTWTIDVGGRPAS